MSMDQFLGGGQVVNTAPQTTTPTMPQSEGRFSDIGEDIATSGKNLLGSLRQRFTDVKAAGSAPGDVANDVIQKGGSRGRAFMEGLKRLPETALVGGANVIGAGADIFLAPFTLAGKTLTKQSEEDAISGGIEKAVNATGIPEKISNMSERGQRNVRAGLSALDGVGIGLTGTATSKFASLFGRSLDKAEDVLTTAKDATTRTYDSVFKDATDELTRRSKDPTVTPREREEAARSALNLKEKLVNLQPDQKARLAEMGPEKLQEYIDSVHLRNIDDKAPTPYELGSKNVDKAMNKLQGELTSTGSSIGKIRQKLGTYQASIDSMNAIESSFANELKSLNLEVVNGTIRQVPGTVSKTGAASDLSVLQDLYDNLKVVKQSPTLTNLIDLRMAFDGKIKFGKSASEVSNSVDPLSRSVRAKIADEAARIVGPSNAGDLMEYSDFMDAFGDLKSYTDRAAGGEYLLRLVLSGRGGESRKLIESINKYTGVDLMNDATAMKLVTDMLGNDSTKNLFRQEITNAGYDAAVVLSGSPTGMVQIAAEKLIEYGIDKEAVLKAAAAGTGGYLLTTYFADDGALMPGGIAILAAMAPSARVQMITDSIRIVDNKRAELIKMGYAENSATVKANEKARNALIQERNKIKDN